MTHTEIQEALKKRCITQAFIAEILGISPMTVSKVINRVIVSDRVMRFIALKLKKSHTKVFPEYYLQPPKRSTSKVVRHGKAA